MFFLAIHFFELTHNLSILAEQFSAIVLHTLSLTKYYVCHFFAVSPSIVTPIDSPILVDLQPPSNTEYIRNLSRLG